MLVEFIKKIPDDRKNQDLKIWLGFSVFYLLWCTMVVDGRVDHFFFYLLISTCLFWTRTTRNFALGFTFFAAFWIIYDGLRVFPNYLVNAVHLEQPYNLEKSLFGIMSEGSILTPNEYFRLHENTFFDVASAVFYLTWVPVPLILAAYLFRKNTRALLEFTACYLLTNLIGFVIYYAYPAAPPWYYDKFGNVFDLSVKANAAGLLSFDKLIDYPLFENMYTKNSNVFAAIPSLHAAYPVVTWFFARKYSGKLFTWIVFIDIVGIWFSAVYSFHHYVIDVLLGGFVAVIAIFTFENVLMKSKFSEFMLKFARFIDN